MNNDSSSCNSAVAGAAVAGIVIGAVSVALLNKTIRTDIQSSLTDASDQLNKKLVSAQAAITDAASGLKEKSRDTLLAELKESQRQLKAAEKQLAAGKKTA